MPASCAAAWMICSTPCCDVEAVGLQRHHRDREAREPGLEHRERLERHTGVLGRLAYALRVGAEQFEEVAAFGIDRARERDRPPSPPSSSAPVSISRHTRSASPSASASAPPIVNPPSGSRWTEPNSHTVLSPPLTSQSAGSARARPAQSAATAADAEDGRFHSLICVHPFDARFDAAVRLELDPAVGRAAGRRSRIRRHSA